MAKRQLPEDRPLDDGARQGPETWRVIEGVEFCHWDRWLLRLALSEPDGLQSIASTFRSRRKARRVFSLRSALLKSADTLAADDE